MIILREKTNIIISYIITTLLLVGTHDLMAVNNILGEPLAHCGRDPVTGYFRDGYCNTTDEDHGTHVVCAVMTEKFLSYTKSQGNDLSTPNVLYRFPGLKPGDRWCLCALRWREAFEAGVAPDIDPASTHEKALKYIPLETLLAFRNDRTEQQ